MSKTPETKQVSIPWKKIRVPVWQQRRRPEKIAELGTSMVEVGQLEPVIVEAGANGTFILRAGRRRHAAFSHNGWEGREMLAIVRTYVKGDMLGPIADNWIENSQRVDVSFIDQARWVYELVTGTYPVEEGEEAVPHDKVVVGDRLGISRNYLNKMLSMVENVDVTVIDKAVEAKVPAHLAIKLTQVKGVGKGEEQEKSRKARQKELIQDYKTAQDRLEAAGRKRGVRFDKGRISEDDGSAKIYINPSKKLDKRGRTAEEYLGALDAKMGNGGKATDKAYYQGMHDMLWWLTGNKKTLAGLEASDFSDAG